MCCPFEARVLCDVTETSGIIVLVFFSSFFEPTCSWFINLKRGERGYACAGTLLRKWKRKEVKEPLLEIMWRKSDYHYDLLSLIFYLVAFPTFV